MRVTKCIFVCGREDLRSQIYEGSQMMEKVKKIVGILGAELDEPFYYNPNEIDSDYYDEIKKRAIQSAYRTVRREAIKKLNKKIVKSLLDMNMSAEDIMKVTDLSKSKYDRILKEIATKK